jgi:hypothetical protein
MNTPSTDMPQNALTLIPGRLGNAPECPPRFLRGAAATLCLDHLLNGTPLGGRGAEVTGRSVLIATRDQFVAALALIELDGVAGRLIVCTPHFPSEHLPALVAKAGIDTIVSDHDRGDDGPRIPLRILSNGTVTPSKETLATCCRTEWVLLTSGTAGTPKMLVHTFASLTAAIGNALGQGTDVGARPRFSPPREHGHTGKLT